MFGQDVAKRQKLAKLIEAAKMDSNLMDCFEDASTIAEGIEAIAEVYADNRLHHTRRKAAGEALSFAMNCYRLNLENEQESLAREHFREKSSWEKFTTLPWGRWFKRGAFSILVCFGIVNATAEAFDGVSSVLFALGAPMTAVMISCVVLGLFSVMLYFAFELTRLSNALGIKFIERFSEADRLLSLQSELVAIKRLLEVQLARAIQEEDFVSFADASDRLAGIYRSLEKVKLMVKALKEEKPSWVRQAFKYMVAALAGFLSGALAFFNGEALLNVASKLFGFTLGPTLSWLPVVLGVMCLSVVTSVALANEGTSMMRLIDKLLGKPSKLIDKKLDLRAWAQPTHQAALTRVAREYLSVKQADDLAEKRPTPLFENSDTLALSSPLCFGTSSSSSS